MVTIALLMVPFSKGLAWYLKHRQEQDLRQILETTKRKGIAVGKLAHQLKRSTLSK